MRAFVFTSTTSTFGRALVPPAGEPAAWITEDVVPVPKNIYGATKVAAEDLCELVHRDRGLPCIVLRTSRFFPEDDDDDHARNAFDGDNLKVSEFLYRRVDIEDVVDAHLLAHRSARRRSALRATSSAPPRRSRATTCASCATTPLPWCARRVPDFDAEYARRGWAMVPAIDRVYVNERARRELGWQPRHDFAAVIARLRAALIFAARWRIAIGSKGYHRQAPVSTSRHRAQTPT